MDGENLDFALRICFDYDRTMKAGPDIARIAALVGDPARANMLTALIGGRALTASELAQEAGVTQQTASSHLAKLEAGGLIVPRKQGRHRYFSLADGDVARVLEGLMGLAARAGHTRVRTGPREPALREARVCYDHLAGTRGVQLFDALEAGGVLARDGEAVTLSADGSAWLQAQGLDVAALARGRRPLCRTCLDWSARRSHLAGALGAALLRHMQAQRWLRREADSRILRFSPTGLRAFERFCALAS